MRAFHQVLQIVQPSQVTVIAMFLAITLGFLLAITLAAGLLVVKVLPGMAPGKPHEPLPGYPVFEVRLPDGCPSSP